MSVGQLNRFSNPENHPRWKGGEIRHRGYTWIRAIGHPRANRHGYVKRAFLVVEDILGLIVPHEQELHHINQDKTDDRLINLAMLSHAEHSKLHGKLRGGLNYARI